jgi:hypothetical protein
MGVGEAILKKKPGKLRVLVTIGKKAILLKFKKGWQDGN